MARLAEMFGLLALVLACLGLYGVTAYAVTQRTNEIGIRNSAWSRPQERPPLSSAHRACAIGIGLAIGIPVALASGLVLAGQLYGVKSYDPSILALAAAILAACALLSASVPARRATRIDPLRALRYQ